MSNKLRGDGDGGSEVGVEVQVEVQGGRCEEEVTSFVRPQQRDKDHEEKIFFSPVELHSQTVPRSGVYSETSVPIAPEVTGSSIASPDSPSANLAGQTTTVEFKERDSGLVPRGLGTCWGPKSKTARNLVLVILVFVVLVLIGTLLGVFLGRRNGDQAPSPGKFEILDRSKLAAVAFRDASNGTDRSVFFQHLSFAIMRARWNSTTAGWKYENVSQKMMDGGSYTYPKAGTALVAVSPDSVDPSDLPNFWLDLYFMSASNEPLQIWSWSTPQTDPSKDQLWHPEVLQSYQSIYTTGFARGTQLAAYRDQCGTICSQSSRLLYQGANKDLMLGSSLVSDWRFWNVTDLSGGGVGEPRLPELEMNSSIAMTRYSPAPGTDPSGMRIYYDVSHQLEEYLLVNGTWSNGGFTASLGDQEKPPDVSVVAYPNETGGTSLDRTLLTVLFDNGTVAIHWQESVGGPWQMGFAPPTNVTALAINHRLMAYCLSEGRIQEWDIDRFSPTNWTIATDVTFVKG